MLKLLKDPDTFTMIPAKRMSNGQATCRRQKCNLHKLRKYPAHFIPISVKSDSIGIPTKFGSAFEEKELGGQIIA